MQIEVFNIDEINMPFIKYNNQNANNMVSVIAKNTEQTWQPDRNIKETIQNTKQGKLAEDIFQKFVQQSLHDINILSYDDIRNDDYKKHAPFDFLVWCGNVNVDGIINSIKYDIDQSLKFVTISKRTRKLCKEMGVKIVEIKSTKVAARHKQAILSGNNNYDNPLWIKKIADKILRDDFLAYPSKCRKTSLNNFDMNNYAEILKEKGIIINNNDDIRKFEIEQQLCDIFVRIYLDEPEKAAFLVGWIDKCSFYQNAVLKKMPQFNKSELALYFAVSLMKRHNFDSLEQFSK